MNTIRILMTCAFVAMMGNSIQSRAEDIDLYSSAASVTGTDLPNVLFILDNAANFNASAADCNYADTGGSPSLGNTTGGIEQCALVNAINSLPVGTVNIGIMAYNKTGMDTLYGCNASATGGCLVKPIIKMDAAGKAAIIANIKAWSSSTIQSNNEATAQAMQEAWAYYAGKQGISGTSYTSPALTGCAKNYVIFVGNAFNNSGSPGDASASPGANLTSTINANAALTAAQRTMLGATIQVSSGAYGTSTFTCSPNPYTMPNHTEASGLYADEWARYMHTTDLKLGRMPANRKVFTYTIGVLSSSCKGDYPALLTSIATQGGGKYFPTGNSAEIQQAILRILNEVQAVNSVFSSSSLPVSVNTQGTYLNQIFMGMFRPDAGGVPRWMGNLKQYQFSYNATTQTLALADATGTAAISAAGTGFLSPNAASFWTCASAAQTANLVAPYSGLAACNSDPAVGFWANHSNGVGLAWDLPDGEVVEKGGAAQMLRLANLSDTYTATPGTASNPRNLYTYLGTNAVLTNAANVFDRSNGTITDAMLGTGPVTISSITSAATVQATSTTPTASAGGTPTVSITALAKSNPVVTATVSVADLAKLAIGTKLKIATGATKYDCNPCTVATINATNNTFTYSNSGGAGTPTLPSAATIYSNFVTLVRAAHGLPVGQTVTLSACTLYNNVTNGNLNGTIGTVITVVDANTITLATTVPLVSPVAPASSTDAGCNYTPNTATVSTTASHGLPNGAVVTIAGASGSTIAPYTGFNGTWTIAVTAATTFTYQYTAAAPLASFGAGATASNGATSRDSLLRWVRGEDNYGDEASLCPPGIIAGTGNCPNPTVNIRPSVHGDVLHSRPVVLNYGGTNGVVVFYGGNDGVFRAVNGNQTNPVSSTLPSPGAELWGFIPSEFFGKLKRLHDNSPALLMPSTPAGIVPTPLKKDYFVDGSTGVYQVIDGNGVTTKAYLYLAMRRGGPLLYALDVTDPKNPKFLWKHSNADAGFGELGQTWSQPKVARVKGYCGGATCSSVNLPSPVLIFGAGYSVSEDTEPPTADASGRGIFILDAMTGAIIWAASQGGSTACAGSTTQAACQVAGMTYSIPSDVTLLDRNNDGLIDRLYVGDVGGNVWRTDLEPTGGNTPNFWQVEKLAALGCSTGPCAIGTTPRKIMYPPEVIATASYDAVFVATGDREHPLYSTAANSACSVTNRAYLLKDLATGMNGSGNTTITEQPGAAANLFDATATPWNGTMSGYYVTFNYCEKSVNAPLVTAGYIYFGTSQAQAPNQNTCEESLGEAVGYKLKPFAGTFVSGEFEGGGLPPSPVSGVVNIVDASGKITAVAFCIGCGGEADNGGNTGCGSESALAGCKPPISVSTSRKRTYWYLKDK